MTSPRRRRLPQVPDQAFAPLDEGAELARLRERGAAKLARQVKLLLEGALQRTGKTQQQLADILGVTPGRVSQLVHGDGNLTIASLARVMSALEYEVFLTAESKTHAAIVPRRRRPRQESVFLDFYHDTIYSHGELKKRMFVVEAGVDASAPSVDGFECIKSVRVSRDASWVAMHVSEPKTSLRMLEEARS